MGTEVSSRIVASALALALASCTSPPQPEPLAGPPPSSTVENLEKRIAQLEQQLAAQAAEPGGAASVVAGQPPVGVPAAAAGGPATPSLPATPSTPGQADAGGTADDEDGDMAVSDDELALALSRTLVDQGALVLPPLAAEVVPEVAYSHRSRSGLQLFDGADGPVVGLSDTRRDNIIASVSGRLGLPYASQVEVQVPYRYERTRADQLGAETADYEHGLGDVQVSFAKQLLREEGLAPDLLGSVSWSLPTGDAEIGTGRPSLGSGYHAVQAKLTALKSQDPLVYYGSLGYTWNFSDTISGFDVEPGNAVNLRLGTILAVSPYSSLRTLLNADFQGETRVDGVKVPGSDDLAASLDIGLATVLTDKMLLDVVAGIGITDAAPDLKISVALPYRF